MSSTNVELARCVVGAINDRDVDGLVALLGDGFEGLTPVANTQPTTYYGADGVRGFFQDARRWQTIEARVEEFRDLGDRVLVLGELSWSHSRGGSLDVVGPLSSLMRFEAGKLTRIETYRDAREAFAAAGLP
jgi:ketosteroid isomerase-like protein